MEILKENKNKNIMYIIINFIKIFKFILWSMSVNFTQKKKTAPSTH